MHPFVADPCLFVGADQDGEPVFFGDQLAHHLETQRRDMLAAFERQRTEDRAQLQNMIEHAFEKEKE